MAAQFPEMEWTKKWADELEDDEEYTEATKGWGEDFNGGFVFTITEDDNLPEDTHYYLDLVNDEVRSIEEIESPNEVDIGFHFKGDYNNWVTLIKKGHDPIEGVLSGTFQLEGDMDKAVEYNRMASHMFTIASQIETEFKY